MVSDTTPWWKHAVIYQIYPRSFYDSNADGVGDIPGIIEKLDYLRDLGVDALWLSPVYVSPNKDYGYDIADYRHINPEYGTLDDMKHLIAEAKARGMRIIMDLVVNHTSDQHPWFEASRNPDSPFRDYYIWRKPKNGHAPNNWSSIFTGSAWTLDPRSGEYYLHLFTAGQPDLNYKNPKAVKAVKDVMTYWLDLGVAGFRCDVVNLLDKASLADGKRRIMGTGQEHYLSTSGTHEILQSIHHDVLGPRGAYTVGEIHMNTLAIARKFTRGDELDTVFSFEHVRQGIQLGSLAQRLKHGFTKWQQGLEWNTIFLENHDQPRSVSTYGDVKHYHVRSAKMLATIILTLRGTPFIYQGQEIGMTNAPLSKLDQTKDPVGPMVYDLITRAHGPKWLARRVALYVTRDHARTPMQWSGGVQGGFSTAQPWLMVNPNHTDISVARQQDDDDSILAYYRRLIALRKSTPALTDGDITFYRDKRGVMAYTRHFDGDSVTVIVNLTKRRQHLKLRLQGEVLISNVDRTGSLEGARLILAPYESLVVRN